MSPKINAFHLYSEIRLEKNPNVKEDHHLMTLNVCSRFAAPNAFCLKITGWWVIEIGSHWEVRNNSSAE
ncbi:unnamed protein product [Gongylonema pulchrum]|uniref:Uncharacterized protein n=1 Tax=Gongylonema pulchrum TaxID=637853 RepID=A0A183DWE3_9BILA|nr:unnamed protein product [Gongylonema pulchrum]